MDGWIDRWMDGWPIYVIVILFKVNFNFLIRTD